MVFRSLAGASSVERYRRGEIDVVPYDLSEPLDLAMWTALQLYVGYLETVSLEALESEKPDESEGVLECSRGMLSGLGAFDYAADLEARMLEIRDLCSSASVDSESHEDNKEVDEDRRFEMALGVLRLLSTPIDEVIGDGVGVGASGAHFEWRVRRNFWECGEVEQDIVRRARVCTEPPVYLPERLAPLYGALKESIGPLVSQSDAARQAGLTPRGMALRIERSGVRRVRVGQYVYVRKKDLPQLLEAPG